jgi:hypothetical protein
MPKITIHVWHDIRGGIVAVGHPVAGNKTIKVTPIAKPPYQVLENEIDQELVANLHETHTVDVEKRTLVARPK